VNPKKRHHPSALSSARPLARKKEKKQGDASPSFSGFAPLQTLVHCLEADDGESLDTAMILVLDREWWCGLVVPVMFTSSDPFTWTWADIIERNTGLLKPIIDALFVLLGGAARLSPGVHRRILRVLRPAESAVRRLIVIAARDVVAKPVVLRPKPIGLIIGKGLRSESSFQLFDPRKRFAMFQQTRKRKVARVPPRFYRVGSDPPGTAPWYAQPCPIPPVVPAPPPPDDGLVDGARLSRRLNALQSALDDIPRQATRLARWRLRRLSTSSHLRAMDVMRYGKAPGYRKQKRHEIDNILADCHAFACEIIKESNRRDRPDTS
jgi:hypothetical protein